MSLILLIPIILRYNSTTISERALKYFIIQIIRGLFILLFILLQQPILYCLIMLLFIKLGLAPFFIWVPQVYSGSSYFIIGLISTIIKIPSLVIISILRTTNIYIFFRGLSVFLGRLAGVIATHIKKLLAYSRISQTGILRILVLQSVDWVLYFIFICLPYSYYC